MEQQYVFRSEGTALRRELVMPLAPGLPVEALVMVSRPPPLAVTATGAAVVARPLAAPHSLRRRLLGQLLGRSLRSSCQQFPN